MLITHKYNFKTCFQFLKRMSLTTLVLWNLLYEASCNREKKCLLSLGHHCFLGQVVSFEISLTPPFHFFFFFFCKTRWFSSWYSSYIILKKELCEKVKILKHSWRSNPKTYLSLFYQIFFCFELSNKSWFSCQGWPETNCKFLVWIYFVFYADFSLCFIIFDFQKSFRGCLQSGTFILPLIHLYFKRNKLSVFLVFGFNWDYLSGLTVVLMPSHNFFRKACFFPLLRQLTSDKL